MPLVIFDGPEAAGKSTILDALIEEWGSNSRMRSWGPRKSWLEYCQALFEDIEACKEDQTLLIAWSRSWMSRSVYNKLLAQGQSVPSTVTRELEDIVLRNGGLLFFVVSPVAVLMSRRLARLEDSSNKPDHPIEPHRELAGFQEYARGRKWRILQGNREVQQNIHTIMSYLVSRNPECRMDGREEVAYGVLDGSFSTTPV